LRNILLLSAMSISNARLITITFKRCTSIILKALLPKSFALYTSNINNNSELCYDAVVFL
jgi:hypothetical protein